MRIVLFTGKGGAGKTTTAAASAVQAARAGISTLVMSTDSAHSLGDALERDLDDGRPVEIEPSLYAVQAGARRGVDRSWRTVQDYLLDVLSRVGVDPVVAEELTSLPGADTARALLELRAQAVSGQWDLVIVDCAPTAETLRLLALPEVLAWHLGRLLPAQRALLRTLRPAAAAATGGRLPTAEVVETLMAWHGQMRELQQLLTSDRTSVRLVVTPERVVLAESRRTWTSLSLYGLCVDQVVVNRVVPDAALEAPGPVEPDPWRSAWNAAQREGLREVADSFSGVPVVTAPYLPHEPVGVDALHALARARGDHDAASLLDPVTRGGPAVRRAGTGYLLTLPLPLAQAGDVDLKRRGDELIIGVGEHRRVLALPAVLKRCVVRSAALKDGTLSVRFVADEALWPSTRTAEEEATG